MRRPHLLAIAVLGIVVAACGESVTGVASRPAPSAHADLAAVANASLAAVHFVDCPALYDGEAVEVDLGAAGGTVATGRNRLRLPDGALAAMQRIRVRTPASPWLEIRLRVVGFDYYEFERPVTVTIDYSRCAPGAIPDPSRLRVVYVDEVTKQPLEDMGGVVDTIERTITFETGHFSSYVVAD